MYICFRIHRERHICTGAERAILMCISLEFINKDTFVQTQKDQYKCVFLSNSSRKTHLYRHRKTNTNVYFCRIHQEGYICTAAERAVQMSIYVEFIKKDTFVQVQKELYKCVSLYELIQIDTFLQVQKELSKCVSLSNSSRKINLYWHRKSCTNVYLSPNTSRMTHLYRHRKNCTNVYLGRIHQERHIGTGAERAVQINDRIHQERNICTDAGRAVQMCISVKFIKKDTFVQAQKELYKCVSLSNSSRKTHFYIHRKSCTTVYLCRFHQERHICTGTERAVQMCISVEFIKKDTFLQVQKELYKCVSLSNSSRKTHLYRRRKTCTNVYLCRIHQERHICTGAERAVQMCISVRIHLERHIGTDTERAVQMCISVEFIKKDTFLPAQKELCKYVSLSNS